MHTRPGPRNHVQIWRAPSANLWNKRPETGRSDISAIRVLGSLPAYLCDVCGSVVVGGSHLWACVHVHVIGLTLTMYP